MPVYKNNDPAQGRFVVAPDGRLVYHEQSQRTKDGWREATPEDIAAAPHEQKVKCGHSPRHSPPPVLPEGMSIEIRLKATGTVTDGPPPEVSTSPLTSE